MSQFSLAWGGAGLGGHSVRPSRPVLVLEMDSALRMLSAGPGGFVPDSDLTSEVIPTEATGVGVTKLLSPATQDMLINSADTGVNRALHELLSNRVQVLKPIAPAMGPKEICIKGDRQRLADLGYSLVIPPTPRDEWSISARRPIEWRGRKRVMRPHWLAGSGGQNLKSW